MTRRANDTQRAVTLAGVERSDRRQTRPSRQQRSVPRSRTGPGVGVDASAPACAESLEGVHEGGRMHALELVSTRGQHLDRAQRAPKARVFDAVEHRRQSSGAFGVTTASFVVRKAWMGGEQHRHKRDASVDHR